ncbi:MAG TPA: hypothetical protein VHB79_36235 [Polyangiaceae bacterium]|nr:hypothetical protein [Polyangiaceae bacterium]
MNANRFLGLGWGLWLAAAVSVGCGKGSAPEDEARMDAAAGSTSAGGTGAQNPQPMRQTGDLNAPAGSLGGRCERDSDCRDGSLRCLAPAGFPSGTKYCAPPCSQASDCQAFAQTSYAISVPLDPDGFGHNSWESTLLERGVGCGVSAELGGEQKYCQFFCVENAAVKSDYSSCTCLPRYQRITDSAGKLTRCDWDDASQCSPLRYPGRRDVCDACNSKPLIDGCYTGKYFCQFNRTFNGNCVDGALDVGTLQQCIAQGTNDCDPVCYENCAGSDPGGFSTSDACLDLCCKSSNRPASERPACTNPQGDGGAGAGSAGGVNGSAGSASGGAAGVNGSGGSASGGTATAGSSSGGSGVAGGTSSSAGTASVGGGAGGGAPPSSGGGAAVVANPCEGKVAHGTYCGWQLGKGQFSTLYTCEDSEVVSAQTCDICSGTPPTCTFEQAAF